MFLKTSVCSQRRVLNANDRGIKFEILSNPEFLAEGPYHVNIPVVE